MAHEQLVRLIDSHKVRIARALARQVRGLSSNYASLDSEALESNFVRLLGYVAHFLRSGDDVSLKDFAAHTAQLRSALGFSMGDFLLATLVFLPVMRQFLVEHSQDRAAGMRAYEEFEAIAIPVIAETATMFRQVTTDFDDDDADITKPDGRAREAGRFAIESVVGGPDDELNPFG